MEKFVTGWLRNNLFNCRAFFKIQEDNITEEVLGIYILVQ